MGSSRTPASHQIIRLMCDAAGPFAAQTDAGGDAIYWHVPAGECVVNIGQMSLPVIIVAGETVEQNVGTTLTADVGRPTAFHQEDAASLGSVVVGAESSWDEQNEDRRVAPAQISLTGVAGVVAEQTATGVNEGTRLRFDERSSPWTGLGTEYSATAVREFRVTRWNFTADHGAAGGEIRLADFSGGEIFHGSVQITERSSFLAATNPYSVVTRFVGGTGRAAPVKPHGTVEHFDLRAGGPVPKLHRWRPHFVLDTLLNTEQAAIISSAESTSFYALTSGQRALLANRGVSVPQWQSALGYLDALSGESDRNGFRLRGLARLDLHPTQRDETAAEYVNATTHTPAVGGLGPASDAVVAWGRGSYGTSVVALNAFAGHWLHTFTPRWSAELTAEVAHALVYDTLPQPLAAEPTVSVGGLAPEVKIGPQGFAFGTPASLGRSAYPEELREDLGIRTWFHAGRHVVTLGGEWRHAHERVEQEPAYAGAFSYDSGTANGRDGGLVDWISDAVYNVNAYPNGACPSVTASVHDFCFRTYRQSFGANRTEFAVQDYAAYVHDSARWHAWLLGWGVRYEYALLPLPQQPNSTLDAQLAALGKQIVGKTSVFPEDRNNVAPRITAAYQRGPWSLRMGAGVFYAHINGGLLRSALADTALPNAAGSALHVRITPSTITPCPQGGSGGTVQGFGYACAYITQPPSAVLQTTSATIFAHNFRSPLITRAQLAVERSFGKHMLASLGYAGANAIQLPATTDANLLPAGTLRTFVLVGGSGQRGITPGATFVLPSYTVRPIQQYGPVTVLQSNANATYHSAVARANVHSWHHTDLFADYTFSRAIDYAPLRTGTPPLQSQLDPFTDGYDKALSSQNIPHRLYAGIITETSFALRSRQAMRWINHWRMSAVGAVTSGAPYTYEIFGGSRLRGGHESINGAGGATYLPTIGRNTLRMPARGRLDLRLSHDADVRGLHLRVFAEAYNALNSPGVSRVETRGFLVGTPAFTGAATPLIFQDAATIAQEGLSIPAFGQPLSSTVGSSKERQVELGVSVRW